MESLYLPISKETLKRTKLLPMAERRAVIESLGVPELASFILLTQLAKHSGDPSGGAFRDAVANNALEKKLALLISNLNAESSQKNRVDIVMGGIKHLYAVTPDLIDRQSIKLLSTEEIQKRQYLTSSGEWNFDFEPEQQTSMWQPDFVIGGNSSLKQLSRDQLNFVNYVHANPDERTHLEGVGGGGKTALIVDLCKHLTQLKSKALILVRTSSQRNVIVDRLGGMDVDVMLIGLFAEKVLAENRIRPINFGKRSRVDSYWRYEDYVRKYHFQQVGRMTPVSVASVVATTINRFCTLPDHRLSLRHLPSSAARLGQIDKTVLLEYAQQVWDSMASNDPQAAPVRHYHMVKMWSLLDVDFPREYQHVIVDEAHNLTPALNKVLSRPNDPVVVVSMGDRHQQLDTYAKLSSNLVTPPRYMTTSMRVSQHAESLYNKVLASSRQEYPEPFRGLATYKTEVVSTDKDNIPESYCAMLTNTDWSTIHYVRELARNNARFYVADNVLNKLSRLVDDLYALYNEGRNSRLWPVSRYSSWEALMTGENNRFLHSINRMFISGFRPEDFRECCAKALKEHDKNAYMVVAVDAAHNQEFDHVMLVDDFIDVNRRHPLAESERTLIVNRVFLAISRARKTIYLPEHLIDQLNTR